MNAFIDYGVRKLNLDNYTAVEIFREAWQSFDPSNRPQFYATYDGLLSIIDPNNKGMDLWFLIMIDRFHDIPDGEQLYNKLSQRLPSFQHYVSLNDSFQQFLRDYNYI
ncbi:hypothetical protein [Tissierella sp.]|uniref:hypothetical protein n=1 Tax=Tissierella sp. TaxID=41274 RepID=UPI00285CBB67|nr:hypothetical protein [Tissierella sp.]MDR7855211.1 hypothetical protein [Tissierella sp.]